MYVERDCWEGDEKGLYQLYIEESALTLPKVRKILEKAMGELGKLEAKAAKAPAKKAGKK